MRPTVAALGALAGCLLLTLLGCGPMGPREYGASGVSPPSSQDIPGLATRTKEPMTPPKPQWRAEAERPSSAGPTGPRRYSRPFIGSPLQSYSQDPLALRAQVAARCRAARVNGESVPLAQLVGDLYASGVDPGHAAEALMIGACGSLESIVLELVAQGGESVVDSVTSRALLIGGVESEHRVAEAVAAGRERATPNGSGPEAEAFPYAMAYFSSRSAAAALVGSGALNDLYGEATPGFGLYTFVLFGGGLGNQDAAAQGRARELLRLIETYVPREGNGVPRNEVHVFLVAVNPEQADQALSDQTVPILSDPIRRRLASQLRGSGRDGLARRLESRPGPFLVTSPEPWLIPERADAPRLVVDLSGIGSEHLYGIVDAFDRPLPAGSDSGGLHAIRERLLALPIGEDPADAGKKDWISQLGRVSARQVYR